MSAIAANQARTFLQLFAELRPHIRTDRNFPARLQQRLAKEKRFGSRDRRLYRELCYTAVRFLPWIETLLARSPDEAARAVVWLAADIPATRPLRETLIADWPSTPSTIAEKAGHLGTTEPLLPAWFQAHCPAAFHSPEIDTLHTRAPLWLRLQTEAPRAVFDEFSERGWRWRASEVLPHAFELQTEADVTQTDAYQHGLVEVQDLGSQLILAAVGPAAGSQWLDACAGAGGKTLQLARAVGPSGRVIAHDVRAAALDELHARANRAVLRNIVPMAYPPAHDARFDGVLVDAPCSGSGTWRRAPHLKWCTTENDVTAAAKLQRELLARYASHVRPGGLLVYATCSLSRVENESVVSEFTAAHGEFVPHPLARNFGFAGGQDHQLSIVPSRLNTDGFFVAAFRKTSS
jgi:16S rRNA (cytosine967-C5)-methyltransferase